MPQRRPHRRDFLQTTAAAGAALSLTAASYARVYGANDRIGVGFLGVGGRCQAHLDIIIKMRQGRQGRRPRRRLRRLGRPRGHVQARGRQGAHVPQGLYPSAKKVGLDPDDKEHVTKDYRKLLDQQGGGRRLHRHAGPLARQDVHRRRWRPARTSTAKSR